jgi:hypothetical protein
MSNWNRRELLNLANAISNCVKTGKDLAPRNQRLLGILNEANQGSKSIFTPKQCLHAIRGALCHVCRSEALATCDREEGWSSNCAFVRTHTDV